MSKSVETVAFDRGVAPDFTRPSKPTDNGLIESLNARLRDEFPNAHEFMSLAHAKMLIEAWWRDFSSHLPHTSLGDLSASEFAHRPQDDMTATER